MTLHVLNRLALVALLSLMVGACSLLPQSGPNLRNASKIVPERGIKYVELKADTVRAFGRSVQVDLPQTSHVPVGQLRLQLGPGDVLRIQMFETSGTGSLFAGAEGAGVLGRVVIDDRGFISLPYAGRMKAAGMTPQELQTRIAQKLSRITVEPAAFVEVVKDYSNSVTVNGVVPKPGRLSLREGVASALDAINQAGGVDGQTWHYDVVLRRKSNVTRRTVSELLNGGDLALQPGDQLLIERNPKRFIALGALREAGAFDFPGPDVSLLSALATARGLSDQQADRTGVYVFRPTPVGVDSTVTEPQLFLLDMSEPDSLFIADAFSIKPGDAVFVTNAPFTDLNKVLEPILRSLSIFRFAINPVGN
jgi:polysaccharide export outer membrane protein